MILLSSVHLLTPIPHISVLFLPKEQMNPEQMIQASASPTLSFLLQQAKPQFEIPPPGIPLDCPCLGDRMAPSLPLSLLTLLRGLLPEIVDFLNLVLTALKADGEHGPQGWVRGSCDSKEVRSTGLGH